MDSAKSYSHFSRCKKTRQKKQNKTYGVLAIGDNLLSSRRPVLRLASCTQGRFLVLLPASCTQDAVSGRSGWRWCRTLQLQVLLQAQLQIVSAYKPEEQRSVPGTGPRPSEPQAPTQAPTQNWHQRPLDIPCAAGGPPRFPVAREQALDPQAQPAGHVRGPEYRALGQQHRGARWHGGPALNKSAASVRWHAHASCGS